MENIINTDAIAISRVLSGLIKRYHISEAELARQTVVPRATINRLVSGRTSDPRASTLNSIAEFFSISVDQLLGKSPIYEDNKHEFSLTSGQIPVLKWEEALPWKKNIIDKLSLNSYELISCDQSIKDAQFSLRVKGDAMAPNFPDNAVLMIDTNKVASNRDYVIIYLDDKQETIFRQLLVDGKLNLLKALNESFPSIKVTGSDIIIGVVIQVRYLL